MVTPQNLVLLFRVRVPSVQQTKFPMLMKHYLKDHRGREVVPVRIDSHTVVLALKDKVTPDYAERFKKKCERSQKMAMNLM